MDQTTIQTIIQGAILITVVYIAAKTTGGGDKPKNPPTTDS
ncbi:hypothetical protein [Parafilimonas sp.]|jgi:hypothetical protein